ncbi:hypothetical protein LCGC14_2915700 [marine sediment metagenome]|uniref:Uncharacterized protein n=1 Tax=marine sediment metagenome TaxID=412755 RepID=A0A0F8YC55_9ZZZZ
MLRRCARPSKEEFWDSLGGLLLALFLLLLGVWGPPLLLLMFIKALWG